MMRHVRFLLLGLLLAAFGAASARAHLEQVLSVTVTNFTGYLIASDGNPGAADFYNRENIAARAQIRFSTNAPGIRTNEYRIQFRLLDAGGNAVPILDETGASNTVYAVAATIRLPFTVFFTTFTETTRNFDAPLVPVGRLSPYERYRVAVTMTKGPPGGTLLPIAPSGQDVLRTYHHFPSTVSADLARNVIATLDGGAYQRTYLVNTVPGKDTLRVRADFTLRRYDGFEAAPVSTDIPLRFDYELHDVTTGNPVALVNSNKLTSRAMLSHGLALLGNPIPPITLTDSEVLELKPVGQLDSVGRLYRVVVRLAHEETPFAYVAANEVTLANRRMLHFNGRLLFGDLGTQFTTLLNDPAVGVVLVGGVTSTLAVGPGGGAIEGSPGHTYGTGAALPVVLRANGNAEYTGAANVAVNQPAPDTNTVANVRVQRTGLVLNEDGGFASFKVWLPAGFGYRLDLNSRVTTGTLDFAALRLNQSLRPAADPTFPPASGLLYGAEETKPLWFEGSELRWDVSAGQFLLKSTGRAVYVREAELTRLAAAPVAQRFKRSNEQLFRTATDVLSPEVEIHAHADGSAPSARISRTTPASATPAAARWWWRTT